MWDRGGAVEAELGASCPLCPAPRPAQPRGMENWNGDVFLKRLRSGCALLSSAPAQPIRQRGFSGFSSDVN